VNLNLKQQTVPNSSKPSMESENPTKFRIPADCHQVDLL